MMEPLVSRMEDYNYQFFRRLMENVKQTKDAQSPEDDDTNMVGAFFYHLHSICFCNILNAELGKF